MAAMSVQIDFWQLVLLLLAFFACVGGFGKLLLDRIDKQLDERFKVQAALLQDTTGKVTQLERDFLEWRADLPLHYVRREDYVRGQSVIEAKLDALYNKLEVVQMKGAGHG
jgi:hypothetical protein